MALDTSKWGREDLIREARLQTEAIQRLDVVLRLGYSMVAIGFLLAWWGMKGAGPAWAGPVGVVLLVLGAILSAILKLGTMRARANVSSILAAAHVELDENGVPKRVGEGAGEEGAGAASSSESGASVGAVGIGEPKVAVEPGDPADASPAGAARAGGRRRG